MPSEWRADGLSALSQGQFLDNPPPTLENAYEIDSPDVIGQQESAEADDDAFTRFTAH